MPNILLSVNCFNRFHGGMYFPRWWEHIESQVVRPYRGMLDVALYDDGSTDEGMVDYLAGLKTAAARRGASCPLEVNPHVAKVPRPPIAPLVGRVQDHRRLVRRPRTTRLAQP